MKGVERVAVPAGAILSVKFPCTTAGCGGVVESTFAIMHYEADEQIEEPYTDECPVCDKVYYSSCSIHEESE